MMPELEGRRLEPNSSLGQSFNYLLKRWERMTCFCEMAGGNLTKNGVSSKLQRGRCLSSASPI